MNFIKSLVIALFISSLVGCNNESQQSSTAINDSTTKQNTSKTTTRDSVVKQDSLQHTTTRCIDIIFEILKTS